MPRNHSPDAAPEIVQILAILHKWGIYTLGQLAALDKEQLVARLGPEAVRLWERANGKSTRLLKLVCPPESFQESFEFEREIETAEPLLFMLRRFLEQLTLRLSAIYLVAKELTLRISFSNKQQAERIFEIPQPTNDVDLLFRMLQTHLENFRSDHPIVAVALEAVPVKAAAQQFALFGTALRNPHQLAETLARLNALLGADRVGTPVLEETHRPDAFRLEPFSWASNTGFQPMGQAGVCACKTNGRQDACPPHSQDGSPKSAIALRRFRPARDLEGVRAVGAQRGPYHLSGSWWDEKAWARIERDVQLEDGQLCRAYQDDTGQKIEGIYD